MLVDGRLLCIPDNGGIPEDAMIFDPRAGIAGELRAGIAGELCCKAEDTAGVLWKLNDDDGEFCTLEDDALVTSC